MDVSIFNHNPASRSLAAGGSHIISLPPFHPQGAELKFVVEGGKALSNSVVDAIRKYYPATSCEPSEGYGRIVALQPGEPPVTLCSFLLDMEPDDVLTLFWVKLKERYPKSEGPR
jgi:hypothetical protein